MFKFDVRYTHATGKTKKAKRPGAKAGTNLEPDGVETVVPLARHGPRQWLLVGPELLDLDAGPGERRLALAYPPHLGIDREPMRKRGLRVRIVGSNEGNIAE